MSKGMPKNDKWMLEDNEVHSQYFGKIFNFDFTYMKKKPIKRFIKIYIWRNYVEGNRRVSGLKHHLNMFKYFYDFAVKSGIHSLYELTNVDISMFLSYLKTKGSFKVEKPLSYSCQKKCLDVLKSTIRWGQIYMPEEVPKIEIFTGNEFRGVHSKLKTEFIPDEVVEQINNSLKNEENPYVKYGIIIMQSIGIRLGDLLKLKIDCVTSHLISGHTMTWYNHKSRKWMKNIPIPNICAIAIKMLNKHTEELRKQVEHDIEDYLFIHKVISGKDIGKIMIINDRRYRAWLNGHIVKGSLKVKGFVHRHNIVDSNGEIYNLSSHQFRRTLATDMYSKGADILVIKDILGHADASTTKKHYSDIKDIERAEMWQKIGIIGNVDFVDEKIISNKKELEWFKRNKNKGARMCDGYCTKPLKNGELCDKLKKRQKCYTCSRYITTPEYLEVHKNHLKDLEQQLVSNVYGEHYAAHIRPTVEILREIVTRLEELRYAYEEPTTATNNE